MLDLEVDRFKEGGKCFIRTYSTDGSYADTKVNLEFVKNSINEKDEIQFSNNKLSLKVNDDYPFLGGSTITLLLPIKLPLTYEINEDKIKIGFNVKIHDGSEDPDKTQLSKFKEKFDKAADFFAKNKETLNDALKDYMNDPDKVNFFNPGNSEDWNKKTEISFIGYAEADKGSSIANGRLYVQLKVQLFNFKWFTIVGGVIPFTVNIKTAGGVELADEISYDFLNSTFLGGLNLKPSLSFDVFAGAALDEAIGGGAYGKAKFEMDWRILDLDDNNGVQSVKMEGEAGLKAYLGPSEWENPFVHDTWFIYTKNNVNSTVLIEDLNSMNVNSWKESIYESGAYIISDLSYLKHESDWLVSNNYPHSFYNTNAIDEEEGAVAKNAYSILLGETYRNAKPVMVSDGNYLYAAFIKAEPSSMVRYLVVAKYDGTSWSEPVRVDAASLFDADPSLMIAANGDLLLSYSKTIDEDHNTILSYANSQVISFGRIEKDTLNYTEIATFDDDDYVYLPKLKTIGNSTYLTWLSSVVSDENDVLHPSSATIHLAAYDGSSILETANHFIDSNISSMALGIDGEYEAVAFVSEETLFEWNIDTNEMFELMAGVKGVVKFDKLPSAVSPSFIYRSDDVLTDINGNVAGIEGFTNEYVIIGNDIYYSKITEKGANLYLTRYDSSSLSWSLPVCINSEIGYLENLSVCATEAGIYCLGMNTNPKINVDSIEDHKDLVFVAMAPVSDMILESVYYETDYLVVGENVEAILTVTNASDHAVESMDILLDGALVKTEDISLMPGETTEVALTGIISCPEELTGYQFYINESGNIDDHPDDNSYDIKIGYCDLEVSAAYQQIGDKKSIIAYVKNKGIESTSGTLDIYDVDGSIYKSYEIDELETGGKTVVLCELGDDFSGTNGGNVIVDVTARNEELFTYNNNYTYFIPETVVLITSIGLGDSYLMLYKNDSYTIPVTIAPQNATNTQLVWTSSDESVAVVNENGTVTALKTGQVIIRAAATDGSEVYGECTIDIVLSTFNYQIRHFLQELDGTYSYYPSDVDYISVEDESIFTPETREYQGFTAPEMVTVQADSQGTRNTDYYYTRNSYTLNVIAETGITEVARKQSYLFEEQVDLQATYDNGYKGVIWSGDMDTGHFTMPAHDVDIHATGVPIDYLIKVNYGAVGIETQILNAAYDEHVTLPFTSDQPGVRFLGWALTPDGEVVYTNGQEVRNLTTVDGKTITLYAVWEYKYATDDPYTDVDSLLVEKSTKVSLYCDSPDSVIYYTLDGTDPTKSSAVFDDAIIIQEDTTIKAFAASPDRKDSAIVSFIYTVRQKDFGDIIPADIEHLNEQGITDPEDIPEGIWTSKLSSFIYDPSVKTYTYKADDLRVYHGNKLLASETDYSIMYVNNKKVGTASLTITGKGNYIGTLVKTFEILPLSLIDDDVKLVLNKDTFKYTGKVQKASISSLEYKGIKLKTKTDYVATYEDSSSVGDESEPRTYNIAIELKGNYSGLLHASYTILPKSETRKLMSSIKISGIKPLTYTGEELFQLPVLKDGKTVLNEGTDYALEYADNIQAGTAYVRISGINNYEGSIIKSFKINPIKLTGKNTEISGLPETVRYQGIIAPKSTLSYNGNVLEEGKDYIVSFKNNDRAGTATVSYKGIGNYSGTISKTFKITKISLNDLTYEDIPEQLYLKGGSKPDVVIHDVYNNIDLKQGKDYTLSYKNNAKIGTATISIKGKGNYEGSLTRSFDIVSKTLDEKMISIPDKVYSAKANGFKSAPVLTDTNGKTLKAGTDYEKSYVYTYRYDSYVIDGSDKSKPTVFRSQGEEVRSADIVPTGTLINVTVIGKGNYEGSAAGTYRIIAASIAKATVSVPVQYYTGKPVTLSKSDITVKLNKQTLKSVDFEIVPNSYAANTDQGTAKVTIKGKGNYGGTKTISFKIAKRSLGLTIKFNPNGATSGSMKDQTIYKDSKLTKNTFKRDFIYPDGKKVSLKFLGWNTRYDGSGDSYDDKAAFLYDPDKAGTFQILYAMWDEPYDTHDVGVIMFFSNNEKTAEVKNAINESFTEINSGGEKWYRLHFVDASNDESLIKEMSDEFISQKYNSIMLCLDNDFTDSNDVIESLKSSNIPIACCVYDPITEFDLQNNNYFIGERYYYREDCDFFNRDSYNYQYRVVSNIMQLINMMPDHGDINNDGITRCATFERRDDSMSSCIFDGIDLAFVQYNIIHRDVTSTYLNSDPNDDFDEISNNVYALLNNYYNRTDMVLLDSPTGALGALDGIRRYDALSENPEKTTKMYVIGLGSSEETMQAVKEGSITGMLVENRLAQVTVACKAVTQMLETGSVYERVYSEAHQMVTKENVASFLD